MTTKAPKAAVVRCERCGRTNRVPAAAEGVPRCGHCHNLLPWITDAGDEDFAQIAEQATVPVLVDLWAPWCAPCRLVTPALEQVAHDLAGRLKLVKVNIDDNPRTAQRFAVQAVPTLLVLNRGRVVQRKAGAAPAPQLRAWASSAVATAAASEPGEASKTGGR
jgi:thioredoxin 2